MGRGSGSVAASPCTWARRTSSGSAVAFHLPMCSRPPTSRPRCSRRSRPWLLRPRWARCRSQSHPQCPTSFAVRLSTSWRRVRRRLRSPGPASCCSYAAATAEHRVGVDWRPHQGGCLDPPGRSSRCACGPQSAACSSRCLRRRCSSGGATSWRARARRATGTRWG